MVSTFGWAGFALLTAYLLLFVWGSSEAAQAAGRPVWLFSRAGGRDRLAAMGFRAAFAAAFFGPLLWLALPLLHKVDPFWTEGQGFGLGGIGVFLAGIGAMVAFAAQMSMGASWRVGVAENATDTLVTGGLYRISRNPTFIGQFVLLLGIALAIPSIPTILAPLLFAGSAAAQVRSEEAVLRRAIGPAYDQYTAAVPRWIGLPQRTNTMRQPQIAALILATMAVDQLTKLAALTLLVPHEPLAVLPAFNLTLGFNEGAGFGMLSGIMAGKPLLMAAATGILTLIMAIMAFRARHPLERVGLALIVGGALGNIVDRLRQGAVTDFLDLYWSDWHWPTFNAADIAITFGAVILLGSSLRPHRSKEPMLDQN